MKKLLPLTLGLLLAGLSRADAPATHGMLLFGDQQTYASHLPMFHAPHDYQLIMKISLEADTAAGGGIPLSEYAKAKEQGKTLFTLEPQRMDLTKVIDGTIKSFKSHIYDGHFERNGKDLGVIKVKIEKILIAERLNPEGDSLGIQKYLFFGEQGEYYAAHLINGMPSFDFISNISAPTRTPACERRRDCSFEEKILVADSELPIKSSFFSSTNQVPHMGDELGDSIKATVKEVIYIEEGELSH